MKTEINIEDIKKELAKLEAERYRAEAQLHAISGAIQVLNQLIEEKPVPKPVPTPAPKEEKATAVKP